MPSLAHDLLVGDIWGPFTIRLSLRAPIQNRIVLARNIGPSQWLFKSRHTTFCRLSDIERYHHSLDLARVYPLVFRALLSSRGPWTVTTIVLDYPTVSLVPSEIRLLRSTLEYFNKGVPWCFRSNIPRNYSFGVPSTCDELWGTGKRTWVHCSLDLPKSPGTWAARCYPIAFYAGGGIRIHRLNQLSSPSTGDTRRNLFCIHMNGQFKSAANERSMKCGYDSQIIPENELNHSPS